jgi:hypothetical protein
MQLVYSVYNGLDCLGFYATKEEAMIRVRYLKEESTKRDYFQALIIKTDMIESCLMKG